MSATKSTRPRKPSFRTRVIEGRKVIATAIEESARIKTSGHSRSTATRAAYKVKADALDHVNRILWGKE